MSESNASSGGIGIAGLLGVLFVALKLIGVIDWSWWYVTMPFWLGFAIIITIFAGGAIVVIINALLKSRK